MLRLHDYRRCPFCIRVRMVLTLKNLQCEVVPERLRDWSDWMLNWAQTNQKRPCVPVLENMDTGWAMSESNEINLWLDTLPSAAASLTPTCTNLQAQMRQWWTWCDTLFKPAIDLYKYGPNRQFIAQNVPQYKEQLCQLIQPLEIALSCQAYLLGSTLSLADIAILPFIRQLKRTREGEFTFAAFPKVEQWSNNILQANWFTTIVMRKT